MSDVDRAVKVTLGVVIQRAAHDLVAFAVFGVVAYVEMVVGYLVAAQVLDAAESEVTAFAAQFAMHIETVQAAACLQGVDADAAVGGLLARDVHELGGVLGAMKPQGEVELRAFGSVDTEDGQLCPGAAHLVVNPAGGAAVFAEAQVDTAVLQSRCGKVDVEHERGVKRGVFGHGEQQGVALFGEVLREVGRIRQVEQAAVGIFKVTVVFADGVRQVILVVTAFAFALARGQGVKRDPAPGFVAARFAVVVAVGAGLFLDVVHYALRAAPVSSPRKSA